MGGGSSFDAVMGLLWANRQQRGVGIRRYTYYRAWADGGPTIVELEGGIPSAAGRGREAKRGEIKISAQRLGCARRSFVLQQLHGCSKFTVSEANFVGFPKKMVDNDSFILSKSTKDQFQGHLLYFRTYYLRTIIICFSYSGINYMCEQNE